MNRQPSLHFPFYPHPLPFFFYFWNKSEKQSLSENLFLYLLTQVWFKIMHVFGCFLGEDLVFGTSHLQNPLNIHRYFLKSKWYTISKNKTYEVRLQCKNDCPELTVHL